MSFTTFEIIHLLAGVLTRICLVGPNPRPATYSGAIESNAIVLLKLKLKLVSFQHMVVLSMNM